MLISQAFGFFIAERMITDAFEDRLMSDGMTMGGM